MSNMYEVNDHEKPREIAVILSEIALIYYSANTQKCSNYSNAITALYKWYNNYDKCFRILTK